MVMTTMTVQLTVRMSSETEMTSTIREAEEIGGRAGHGRLVCRGRQAMMIQVALRLWQGLRMCESDPSS